MCIAGWSAVCAVGSPVFSCSCVSSELCGVVLNVCLDAWLIYLCFMSYCVPVLFIFVLLLWFLYWKQWLSFWLFVLFNLFDFFHHLSMEYSFSFVYWKCVLQITPSLVHVLCWPVYIDYTRYWRIMSSMCKWKFEYKSAGVIVSIVNGRALVWCLNLLSLSAFDAQLCPCCHIPPPPIWPSATSPMPWQER